MFFESLDNFGFDVLNRNRAEVEPILRCALEQQVPFEVGLYHRDPASHDMLRAELRHSALAVNTHLYHHRLSIFDLSGTPGIDGSGSFHLTLGQLRGGVPSSLR